MKQVLRILVACCLGAAAPIFGAGILTLQVNDVIQPIVAEYVVRGISQAETEEASAIIIRLSTPGGLDQSMREIIEKILVSKVPVISFVGPSGTRAASAGFFFNGRTAGPFATLRVDRP
jgi:membrane-bound serine protease (ClpP class)